MFHTLFSLMCCLSLVLASRGLLAEEPARPLVVAHRGLLKHAPENTLASFRACLELRIGFEFDVRKSKDGVLVCVHDDTLDRTTNGTGPVTERMLAELKRLDAGTWFDPRFAGEPIPTVEEILQLVATSRGNEILIAADLKADDVERDLVALAEKYDVLERIIFIGNTINSDEIRARLRDASPRARTARVANTSAEFPPALSARNADWVYFRFLPTREQLDAVHRAGKRGFIAGPTVAGALPENWTRAARGGMDAILTDFPLELSDRLRTLK